MHWALFSLTLSTPPTTPMVTTCWPFSTLVSLPGALLTLPPKELNSCLPPHPGVSLLHLFTVPPLSELSPRWTSITAQSPWLLMSMMSQGHFLPKHSLQDGGTVGHCRNQSLYNPPQSALNFMNLSESRTLLSLSFLTCKMESIKGPVRGLHG